MDTKKFLKDNIKSKLQFDLQENEALLKVWESVTYPTKKDGKPFASLARNIEGAKLTTKDYGLVNVENILRVSTRTESGRYVSEEIYCYESLGYSKYQKAEDKPQNVHDRGPGLVRCYTFDLDDIKEAVKAQADRKRKTIEAIRKQLATVDSVIDEFYPRVMALKKDLKEAAGYAEYYLMYSMISNDYEFKL